MSESKIAFYNLHLLESLRVTQVFGTSTAIQGVYSKFEALLKCPNPLG